MAAEQMDLIPPSRPPKFFTIPAGTGNQKCRGCDALVYWVKTEKGKLMPVRADVEGGRAPGTGATDHGRGVSHFIDCPRANAFRKRGQE